jgi:hypothetical protein
MKTPLIVLTVTMLNRRSGGHEHRLQSEQHAWCAPRSTVRHDIKPSPPAPTSDLGSISFG